MRDSKRAREELQALEKRRAERKVERKVRQLAQMRPDTRRKYLEKRRRYAPDKQTFTLEELERRIQTLQALDREAAEIA